MKPKQPKKRFKIVDGSQSYHCCFAYTVVDTSRPEVVGGVQYKGQFNAVCECFERTDARLICDALNAHCLP